MLAHITLLAQNSTEPVYLIFTSQGKDATEGIQKYFFTSPARGLDNSDPITVRLNSDSKKIDETFIHIDYILSELAKIREVEPSDIMEKRTESLSFLQTIEPIDLDVLFPSMTKAEAEAFGLSMKGKKIYAIDRNDMTADSLTLIQIKYISLPR